MPRGRLLLTLVVVVGALAACGGAAPEAGFEEQPPPLGEAESPTEVAEPPRDTDGFNETGGGGTASAATSAEPEPDAGAELRPPPIALDARPGARRPSRGATASRR
jgi:hypothetical protein